MTKPQTRPPCCRKCKHHPAEREDECACECHDVAAELVEAAISEYRAMNRRLMTPENLAQVKWALQRQLELKPRLRTLCMENHPKRRRA